MARLTIERADELASGNGLIPMRIGGFTDGELSELKSMEHHEAKEKLLELLDTRNGGTGTLWARGCGVYGMWFDNEFAYLNIGKSAD